MKGRPAVIVYLWDVRTLGGSARGVTDDETKARLAASTSMLAAGLTAQVERAVPLTGGGWLTDGYRRLGSGWSARLRNGQVTWESFRESARELERAKLTKATAEP
jgi:hypothetical protein